ncbi:MAG: Ca-activated chloride channel family protein [Paraglaciecola sp.]|jgi:Ca-activated chloride channel family protein
MEWLTTLHDFHFLRPQWLWAIIPLMVLVWLVRHLHQQQSGWQSVLAGHLYQHLMTSQGSRKSKPPLGLLVLAWIICTLALAGPTWERLPQPVYQLNTGKVVLIDMSLSMRATDISPDRLTRAKYKAIDLVNAINEGETGLVAYAGDAFTISPLSSDAQNLSALIPSLSPEIMPVKGSEPLLGLQAAMDLLTGAGYQQGEIFWISDGVENSQLAEIRELLSQSPFRLSVLGVGTEEGAPIQLATGELMKDPRGAIVIPKLNSHRLGALAKKGRGRYTSMQTDDSDINYLLSQTLLDRDITQDNEQAEAEQADNFGDKWKEMGPYLVLLLLPLAAYSFRRGIITVIFIGLILPGYAPLAQADWWDNVWQTRDQQGKKALEQRDYARAAGKFDDPLWQGAARYKNQDYAEALEAFSQVNSPEALYNQGNTLAQLGKFEEAIAAYDKVLAQQPKHADAIANKTVLEQLKEQQDQQQKSEEGEDGEEGEPSQDSEDGEQQQNEDSSQGSQNDEQEPSEQADSQPGESEQEQDQQSVQEKSEEQKQQDAEKEEQAQAQTSEDENPEEEAQQEAQEAKMGEPDEPTDEEKEQMQRMQALLNRIEDDPSFLLKRKMQIEHQQRKRQRVPTQLQRNW